MASTRVEKDPCYESSWAARVVGDRTLARQPASVKLGRRSRIGGWRLKKNGVKTGPDHGLSGLTRATTRASGRRYFCAVAWTCSSVTDSYLASSVSLN